MPASRSRPAAVWLPPRNPGGRRSPRGSLSQREPAPRREPMTANRPIVIVTRKIPVAVEQELAAQFDARLNPSDTPMTADALKNAMRTADAVLCCVADKMTADIINTSGRKARLLA